MAYVTKDSGARETYASGMVRDVQSGKPRFDLLLPEGVPYEEQFLTRCAALLARGAEKYGDRNWEKANSQKELDRAKSSAFRHFMQWMGGEDDEDHAAAVYYGLMFVETLRYKLGQQAESFDLESQRYNVWVYRGQGTWELHAGAVSEDKAYELEETLIFPGVFVVMALPVGMEPDSV